VKLSLDIPPALSATCTVTVALEGPSATLVVNVTGKLSDGAIAAPAVGAPLPIENEPTLGADEAETLSDSKRSPTFPFIVMRKLLVCDEVSVPKSVRSVVCGEVLEGEAVEVMTTPLPLTCHGSGVAVPATSNAYVGLVGSFDEKVMMAEGDPGAVGAKVIVKAIEPAGGTVAGTPER